MSIMAIVGVIICIVLVGVLFEMLFNADNAVVREALISKFNKLEDFEVSNKLFSKDLSYGY